MRELRFDYLAATLIVGAALLVRLSLDPLIPGRAPWVFYFPAIAVIAWRYGLGPSVWAVVLSGISGWYAWVPPAGTFEIKDVKDLYVLLSFLVSAAVVVGFGVSSRRTRRRLDDESQDRERTSRELAESLESFRGVFEHAEGDAVILMDADFSVVAWNPGAQSIFGYSSPEAVGRRVDFIFPAEERESEATGQARRSAAQSGVAQQAGWFRRKDGERFWGTGSLVALHHSDETIRGYVKVLRDETARHTFEDAMRNHRDALEAQVRERTADLLAANAELEGFTYSVSHDMRTPLRAIVAHSRLLMEDYADELPEEARERIGRMAKASTHMSRLIEDLLTYARLNKKDLQKVPVDLAALFRDIVAHETGELTIDAYAPTSLTVEAEPGLMRMVLENLVGNAIKYRRPDVPLRLKFMLVDHEGECGYALRDNGIGFDMAYAAKLFEPFERLHRNEEIEGTGIGLANVRRIVERHGGKVWAESGEGPGATFGFTLP